MAYNQHDEDLAYGDYPGEPDRRRRSSGRNAEEDDEEAERGFIGDSLRRLRGKHAKADESDATGSTQEDIQWNSSHQKKSSIVSSIFTKVHGAVQDITSEVTQKLSGNFDKPEDEGHVEDSGNSGHQTTYNRFQSFAAQRVGNNVKWYVDGCSYMWAVSRSIESARQSIWILDWWLSPELYLRRPPSQNEQYRIDRMLQAAAERGVKVNIIVYKEVTQALTLSSSHTKHALEDMHPNIAVFRHPDHLPDKQTVASDIASSLKDFQLNAASISKLPIDTLKAVYGANEDTVLYWAHHEKLCIVDGKTAFMGGLDLCFGRWDLNQHPIADAHPENLDNIVFPGQDFNNARLMDFQDVAHPDQNKVDRRDNCRMGWSDVSVCLEGPAVEDLKAHFTQRWNFIYDEKYDVRKDSRYSRLSYVENTAGRITANTASTAVASEYAQPYPPYQAEYEPHHAEYDRPSYPPPPPHPDYGPEGRSRDFDDLGYGETYEGPEGERGMGFDRHRLGDRFAGLGNRIRDRFSIGGQHGPERPDNVEHNEEVQGFPNAGGMPCQIVRSCAKWSHGVKVEQSIANAYINIIQNSEHFVYMENQFFITATSDEQKPVKNKIGAAIVERVIRAAQSGEKFKVIVVIPSIPGFAGDLKDDSSLGTRAIMEFQYNSINRGGHSIMECISNAGYDPTEYIRFYNLRNYDRINVGSLMRDIEHEIGFSYEEAREEHDDLVGAGFGGYGERTGIQRDEPGSKYRRYQEAAQRARNERKTAGRWDSVSECYMLGGEDVRNVPWEAGDMAEIDAFVSEELYVHSKILIADDRVVICGSANLNDRSQLGYHDSEIAIIVEDPNEIDSFMDGQPWKARQFAASLRRQLFRKHLGLIPCQNMSQPNQNSEPVTVGQAYDWGSAEDEAVADPLSDTFLNLWNGRAHTNTEVFSKVFHCVPDDNVRNWKQYDEFYELNFKGADKAVADEADQASGKREEHKEEERPTYKWGHVVKKNFSDGEQGAEEVKAELSRIQGTLVEMPLMFLIDEDIAKEGISLNALTEEVYT